MDNPITKAITLQTADKVSAQGASQYLIESIMSGEADPVITGIILKKMAKIVDLTIGSKDGHDGVKKIIKEATLEANL